jgi:glutamate-1-semialdehyde 2,1-aminomutase
MFHPHHNWFLSAAHTPEDIDSTLRMADEAFGVLEDERL